MGDAMAERKGREKGLIKDIDRHNNVRWYYRRKGLPKIRLREQYGSDAFYEELSCARLGLPYKPANAKDEPPKLGRAQVGTFKWLVLEYMQRATSAMAKSTRDQKRRVLEALSEETCLSQSGTPLGMMAFRGLQRKHIAMLRDQKADKPEAANHRIKALSSMFDWAIDAGIADHNPVAEVKKIKSTSSGHHTWTEAELATFVEKHPKRTRAHLAFTIFRYTGLRICDVAVFGRQHLYTSGNEVRFRITPRKTGKKTQVVVDLPVLPPLAEALEAAPKTGLTFLLTESGKPFSEKGLGNRMRKWFDDAGLHHCSSHGIRKADATIAAENGATTSQLQSIFGWTTAAQAELYTRAASRKKTGTAGAPYLLPRNPK